MIFFQLQFCLLVFLVYAKSTESLKLCKDVEFNDCADIPTPKRCMNVFDYRFSDNYSIDDRIWSIIMEYDTCVILYDRNDCTGTDLLVRGNYQLKENVIKDSTSSIGPCVFDHQPDQNQMGDSQENTTATLELKRQTSDTFSSHPTDSYSGIV